MSGRGAGCIPNAGVGSALHKGGVEMGGGPPEETQMLFSEGG